MKRREFGEQIKQYIVEEDRLQQLLMIEHKYMCISLGFDNDRFEYFWDMMVEAGCDQHVSHKEFVEAVKNMTFEKLAEMDLALYEEYKERQDDQT